MVKITKLNSLLNLLLQDLKLVDKSFLPVSGLGPLLEMNQPYLQLQTALHVLSATKLHLEWKCFVTAVVVHQKESGFITRVTGAWYVSYFAIFSDDKYKISIHFHFFLQNIEEGKKYKVTLYVRSTGDIDVSVSLTSSNGSLTLASEQIM